MNILPFDVIINNIIPYTYRIQPKELLEDIKSYYEIKSKIMNTAYYNIDAVKEEILSIFYADSIALIIILNRHFSHLIFNKHSINGTIFNHSKSTIFNILFGLFTKEERIEFREHLLQGDFFVK